MGSWYQTITQKMFFLLLISLISESYSLSVVSQSCARCQQPEFPPGSGRALYLPHCVDGVSYNYCDAVCTDKPVTSLNRGSCEGCEQKCGMVFKPVCTPDQSLVYANLCQAKCAGAIETVQCKGLNTVIPGKTKLPLLPPHLAEKLQNLGHSTDNSEENF